MTKDGQHGPGLRSVARGMRRLFYALLFIGAQSLGLFLLIQAPDSRGHVERVAGVLIMLCAVAPLVLGPIEELDVLAEQSSANGRAGRSRLRRLWRNVGYVSGGFQERDRPREEQRPEQGAPAAEVHREDSQ
jgi:hypothetical protein